METTRIYLEALKSKKQLRKISFADVVRGGFTDEEEKFFTLTFNVGNGKKVDLSIIFETRTPTVFISNEYSEEQA